jgi:polysaccharide pyruvyl transferase WcaK-like protein
MIRKIYPAATFEFFDVNSRGQEKTEYGLTRAAVERANKSSDLVIIGGSNLYEGAFGWSWGVHLERDALENLRVPLFLIGLGTGSSFDSPLHLPSARARIEIKTLNEYAAFSGVRDVTTFDWLRHLGVSDAKLIGDPATFIFNLPLRPLDRNGHILIVVPPRRIWISKRQFWKVHTRGRAIFAGLRELTRSLEEAGEQVVVACNDPLDVPVAQKLFGTSRMRPLVCPQTPEDYFELLASSRAVVSGRLHTAVVAFSLGIPFRLIDIDGRTDGFIKTYQMEAASINTSQPGVAARLKKQTRDLLSGAESQMWQSQIEKRDRMHGVAMELLEAALKSSCS